MDDGLDEMRMMFGHIRTIAETMLKQFWGERCETFEPTCEVCRRWLALDDLTRDGCLFNEHHKVTKLP